MRRLISLAAIFAISVGVYWVRAEGAGAAMRAPDLTGQVAICRAEEKGMTAVEACDRLLAVSDLKPATRGYFLFRKAYALDVLGEDDLAFAAYNQAEPLARMKRRWVWNNRAWIHFSAKRWDEVKADALKIIKDDPDRRDGAYFGALRILREQAHATRDFEERDRLDLIYLTERPETFYALNRRIKQLERFPKIYPKPLANLVRLGDLTRALDERPDRHEFYLQRAQLLDLVGLRLLAQKDRESWARFERDTVLSDPRSAEASVTEARKVFDDATTTFAASTEKCATDRALKNTGEDKLATRTLSHFFCGDLRAAIDGFDQQRQSSGRNPVLSTLADFAPQLLDVISGTDLDIYAP